MAKAAYLRIVNDSHDLFNRNTHRRHIPWFSQRSLTMASSTAWTYLVQVSSLRAHHLRNGCPSCSLLGRLHRQLLRSLLLSRQIGLLLGCAFVRCSLSVGSGLIADGSGLIADGKKQHNTFDRTEPHTHTHIHSLSLCLSLSCTYVYIYTM